MSGPVNTAQWQTSVVGTYTPTMEQVTAGAMQEPMLAVAPEVRAVGDESIEYQVVVFARCDDIAKGYEIESVHITRDDDGPPVTSEGIRKIPLQRILHDHLTSTTDYLAVISPSARDEMVDVVRDGRTYPVPRRARELGQGRPTDEALGWVALVYKIAQLRADPPTKSVADAFELAPRTASHWVKLARERGFLTD
jgi:hypothetical protein